MTSLGCIALVMRMFLTINRSQDSIGPLLIVKSPSWQNQTSPIGTIYNKYQKQSPVLHSYADILDTSSWSRAKSFSSFVIRCFSFC